MTMLSNFEWWKFFFFFLLNICSISPLELDGVRNASYPLVWYAIANTRTFHSRNKQKIKDISTFLVKKKIILIVLSESDFRTKSLLLSHIRSHSCCAPRREIGINKLWFFTVTWQLQTHLHISVVAILLYGYYFFFFLFLFVHWIWMFEIYWNELNQKFVHDIIVDCSFGRGGVHHIRIRSDNWPNNSEKGREKHNLQ